uniref:NADH dehydrogenase subunit 1 n=1 Tax=Dracunculus medinensis TaxID=318479 RepID=A0A158Q2V0_DRAME
LVVVVLFDFYTLVCVLAELNRAPLDFSQGIACGFNVEYSRAPFVFRASFSVCADCIFVFSFCSFCDCFLFGSWVVSVSFLVVCVSDYISGGGVGGYFVKCLLVLIMLVIAFSFYHCSGCTEDKFVYVCELIVCLGGFCLVKFIIMLELFWLCYYVYMNFLIGQRGKWALLIVRFGTIIIDILFNMRGRIIRILVLCV